MSERRNRLLSYIMTHVERWQNYRQQNYDKRWDEFERLYKGLFNETDKTRDSERSKIVTPAIQQAVDTFHSEIEEAVFGRGEFFDIVDDAKDPIKVDIEQTKTQLMDDFKKDKVKKNISAIVNLGSVFGTGLGEITVEKKAYLRPKTEQIPGSSAGIVGVEEYERFCVKLRPIHPKNFLIDPNASSIEDALGCAIVEVTPIHIVTKAMENGEYDEVSFAPDQPDHNLDIDQTVEMYKEGNVKTIKWFGLVPRDLIEDAEEENADDTLSAALDPHLGSDSESYEDLVEAYVVIINDSKIVKAVANRYMMQDRPIVHWTPEQVPGKFYGRGIVEKGFNMQKAIDAQVRSHLDSLALTSAPMMGIDSTRMPRGAKFTVRPGASVLTIGNPNESLMPFNFGQTSPMNVETSQMFERMLLMATGTLDSAGMPAQVGNQSNPGAMSMALGAIIKKNKRALLSFQDDFLVPFIRKCVWRYMQFDPDRYPAKDYDFTPISTLGIMAREYEQQQYMAMLATLGPDSKIVPLVLKAIVENSSLSNREELAAALEQMSQPDPKQQQMQEIMQQLAVKKEVALVSEIEGKAQSQQANAIKTMEEAKVVPVEAQAKLIAATTNNLPSDPAEVDFEQRLKLTDAMLKEKEIDLKAEDQASNERITRLQTVGSIVEKAEKTKIEHRKIDLEEKRLEIEQQDLEIVRKPDGSMDRVRRTSKSKESR